MIYDTINFTTTRKLNNIWNHLQLVNTWFSIKGLDYLYVFFFFFSAAAAAELAVAGTAAEQAVAGTAA